MGGPGLDPRHFQVGTWFEFMALFQWKVNEKRSRFTGEVHGKDKYVVREKKKKYLPRWYADGCVDEFIAGVWMGSL
jgi:hypothetical protein